MKFDFDRIIDRKNTGSLKWDIKAGELPLWVADMDFETAPCIKEALKKRVEHGVFGYSIIPSEWANSYVSWWKKRHNFTIDRDSLIFCTGVVPAISSLVRKLTTPAEKVLIQTPCYNIFFNSILNNGRFVLESPLDFDGENYKINFDRLERDLSDPQVSLMILCNPQNPTGNIWKKEELARIGDLCKKYGVSVISDEIHCDITEPGFNYTPFASVSETCAQISVSCIAPTKCFNIAGINSAAVVVPNPYLRHKVWRALNTDEIAEPNAFAVDATIAAFGQGEEWLNQLNDYLFENRKYAEKVLAEIPGNKVKVVKGRATYLLWVKVFQNGDAFAEELRRKTGLFINGGAEYGKSGENFVRINLACSRKTLEEAMARFKEMF
ncbi:MAG: pyridoxal phosphate-dependent aminotransferase [Treponema sp.]|nr:pyridoxal phosphate-dependent aminotransferase [Treponema sp.]